MQDSSLHFAALDAVGHIGEQQVIAFYQGYGYRFIRYNKDIRHDLEFQTPHHIQMFAEVKTDCTTSPNLAIETCSRSKPSGIFATTAHHYCVYFTQTGELYIFRAAELREFVESQPLPRRKVRVFEGVSTEVKLLSKRQAQQLDFARRHVLTAQPSITGTRALARPA